ncbi:MAG: primosomal protein N' [Planctomycetes bacterium]|nr:primosomal protein N' [Planctomycetota bacterium]
MHTDTTNQTPTPLPTDETTSGGLTGLESPCPTNTYAEVAINIPLNKTFHYHVPLHLRAELALGMRVRIPFGHKTTTGFCVGFTDTPAIEKTKDIISVIDKSPLADAVMLKLTQWLANHYCCSWGEAIYAVIPPVVRKGKKEKTGTFVVRGSGFAELDEKTLQSMKTRAPKQVRALEVFMEHTGGKNTEPCRNDNESHPPSSPSCETKDVARVEEMNAQELIRISGCSMPGLRSLEKKGYIVLRERVLLATEDAGDAQALQCHLTFTPEQQNAYNVILKKLALPAPGVVLLHGVTSSGKTEIYLQAIAKVIEQGRKAIFLVPEISLTSQTIHRIKSRFHNVAVLHSHLLGAFHYSQWSDIKDNKIDIVIGARSSIFAPLSNVGLIIIDEEHENTYKQDQSPRYHARDVAIMRATYENALVILGSATPSLESYHQAILGNYEKVVLSRRVGDWRLPPVEIVDMAEEARKRRNYHIISQRLEYYMKQVLARREQVILFLNRRGFAPYIHCKRCGFVLKCSRCDIPMTYHKNLNTSLCHYCHQESPPLSSCPDCMAGQINFRGFGTEKIEEELAIKFPTYKTIRMDSDSMRGRGAHEVALTAFERGDYQILLGTQMIAKGLDFPNVTIVGVISADTMLNLPDFRSSERTFQLLSQVSGRTGRGSKGGRVVVQSYNPRHYSITYAANHDCDGFALKELEYRRQLRYPPFGRLARIIMRSPQEEKVKHKAADIANKLKEMVKAEKYYFEILGPAPAPVTRIDNLFRWHILLKSQDAAYIRQAIQHAAEALRPSQGVQAIVDIDAYAML